MLSYLPTLLLEAEESNLFSPDQFAGYAVTAVITIINLLIAFVVIKFFIYKPIMKIINQRQEALDSELAEAKKAKDFAKADAIRASLLEMGIVLEDTREGVKWKRV